MLAGVVACYGQPDTPGKELCPGNPLITAAWHVLASDQRFPCDAGHLVLIEKFTDFLRAHPAITATAKLREKARQAFAFSIDSTWPIYINLDSHEAIVEAYMGSQRWVAFAIAGVLVHERVHAMGNPSEAAALLAEFQTDKRFRNENKLPPTFDLQAVARQYRDAIAEEK